MIEYLENEVGYGSFLRIVEASRGFREFQQSASRCIYAFAFLSACISVEPVWEASHQSQPLIFHFSTTEVFHQAQIISPVSRFISISTAQTLYRQ